MDDKIVATFCLCDDLLKAIHHQTDKQCQMNDAEVMTTALIAALFFRPKRYKTLIQQESRPRQFVPEQRSGPPGIRPAHGKAYWDDQTPIANHHQQQEPINTSKRRMGPGIRSREMRLTRTRIE